MREQIISADARRLRHRGGRWLLGGVGLAVVTAGTVYGSLSTHRDGPVTDALTAGGMGLSSVHRIVAARDLSAGTPLETAVLASRQYDSPTDAPPGLEPDELEQVIGGVLSSPVKAGAPIDPGALVWHPSEAITVSLAPDQRAVTLPSGPLEHDPGLVVPGSHLDLVLVSKNGGATLLLENVSVLAVNGAISATQNESMASVRTLTFAIGPDDADRVADAARRIASNEAVLLPLLRHPEDAGRPRLRPPPPSPAFSVMVFESGHAEAGTLTPTVRRFGTANPPHRIYGDLP